MPTWKVGIVKSDVNNLYVIQHVTEVFDVRPIKKKQKKKQLSPLSNL